MAWIVVVIIRLLVPLTLLRWPLFGAIAAMVADALDVVMLNLFGVQNYAPYNTVDKFLDTYYLAIEAYISWRWTNQLARKTSIFLFIYRLIGVILYEVTQVRLLLFIFPNLFENFFIFYLVMKKVSKKDYVSSWRNVAIILIFLLIPKLFQEYMLHVTQFPIYRVIHDNIYPLLGLDRYFS